MKYLYLFFALLCAPAFAANDINAHMAGGVSDADNTLFETISGTTYKITASGLKTYYQTGTVLTASTYADPSWLTALAWSKIGSTPTSLAGYGISDPVVLTTGTYTNPAWIASLAYGKLTGAPALGTIATNNVPLPYSLISGAPALGSMSTNNVPIPYGYISGTPTLGPLASASPAGTTSTNTFLKYDGTTFSYAAPSVSSGSPSGAAGGDLGGFYPNPTAINAHNLTNFPSASTMGLGSIVTNNAPLPSSLVSGLGSLATISPTNSPSANTALQYNGANYLWSASTGASYASTGTWTAAQTYTASGGASTPAAYYTGIPTGGSGGSANFPLVFWQPSGATAVTTWNNGGSNNGTIFGANSASGFVGNFLDFHTNGSVSVFKVDSSGNVTANNLPTFSGNNIFTASGGASSPAAYYTGIPTGGSGGSANFPLIFWQPSGATAVTTWNNGGSNGGTIFGGNSKSGFIGDFIHFAVNGSDVLRADYQGNETFAGTVTASSFSGSGTGLTGVSLLHASGTPTIAAGPGAGTGPTVSISGNDVSGVISVTAGTSVSGSAAVATITFHTSYSAAPLVMITPSNANATALSANSQVYPSSSSTSQFVISTGTGALTTGTACTWNYFVPQQ